MTIMFTILQRAEWKAMGLVSAVSFLENNVIFFRSLIKIHVPDILLITSADYRSSVVGC